MIGPERVVIAVAVLAELVFAVVLIVAELTR
jgi:hypothetical protein